MLVHRFLDRYAQGRVIHVTAAAMKALLQYDWPGNVRELENCVARAVALGDHKVMDVADLPPAMRNESPDSIPRQRRIAVPFPPPHSRRWSA